MKNELTYQKAYEELSSIVAEVEQDQVELDHLTLKIKRAKELLAFCREKLRQSEQAFLEQVDNPGKNL